MESSLSINRNDLLSNLGTFLGWHRDSMRWTEAQKSDSKRVISQSLRQAYTPPILPGEKSSHRWSFLRPIANISTVTGQADLQLPDDFGGLTGDIAYAANNAAASYLEKLTIGALLTLRQNRQDSTGFPTRYAVSPIQTDGETPQRFQLLLDPKPDGVYEFRVQYRSNPYNLSANTPYPLGGQAFADCLMASCTAAADELLNDAYMGATWARFIDRLRAAVSHDRQENYSGNLGYNGDPSMCMELSGRLDNGFTINGESSVHEGFYFA